MQMAVELECAACNMGEFSEKYYMFVPIHNNRQVLEESLCFVGCTMSSNDPLWLQIIKLSMKTIRLLITALINH